MSIPQESHVFRAFIRPIFRESRGPLSFLPPFVTGTPSYDRVTPGFVDFVRWRPLSSKRLFMAFPNNPCMPYMPISWVVWGVNVGIYSM